MHDHAAKSLGKERFTIPRGPQMIAMLHARWTKLRTPRARSGCCSRQARWRSGLESPIRSTMNVGGLVIGPWVGVGVLAAWATGPLLLGGAVLRLRDT